MDLRHEVTKTGRRFTNMVKAQHQPSGGTIPLAALKKRVKLFLCMRLQTGSVDALTRTSDVDNIPQLAIAALADLIASNNGLVSSPSEYVFCVR